MPATGTTTPISTTCSGPTKRSRKGDAMILGYEKLLSTTSPGAWNGTPPGLLHRPGHPAGQPEREQRVRPAGQRRDRPGVQQQPASRRPAWTTRRAATGRCTLSADHANGETFPKLNATFDFGFALPWGNSSIWLYNVGRQRQRRLRQQPGQLLFRRLPQQLRGQPRGQALSRVRDLSRASRSTRWAASVSSRTCSSGTRRRSVSRKSACPAST